MSQFHQQRIFEIKSSFKNFNVNMNPSLQPWETQKTQNQSFQKIKKRQSKQNKSQLPQIQKFLATVKKPMTNLISKRLKQQKNNSEYINNELQISKELLPYQKISIPLKNHQISINLTPISLQYKVSPSLNHKNKMNKINSKINQKTTRQVYSKGFSRKNITLSPFFQRPNGIETNLNNEGQRNNFQRLLKMREKLRKRKSTNYELMNNDTIFIGKQVSHKNVNILNLNKGIEKGQKYNKYEIINRPMQNYSFYEFAEHSFKSSRIKKDSIRKIIQVSNRSKKNKKGVVEGEIKSNQYYKQGLNVINGQIIQRQKQKINLLLEYHKDYKTKTKLNQSINDKVI